MKRFCLVLILVFIGIFSVSCTDKSAILFNSEKITQDNVMNYSSVFRPNQRIYYLILLPKKVQTRVIDIYIIKKDNQYEQYGYKFYWSYTAKLYEDEVYYYDDYVVIPQKGAYIMKVYSKDNPTKLLCSAQFYVRD